MRTFLALLALLLAGRSALADEPRRRFSAERTEDLHELAKVLKRRTAYLEVKLEPVPDQPLAEKERTGFGVVLEPKLVATNYFVLERAAEVWVIGPKQIRVRGSVVLEDVKRRVALIRTEKDLSETGLVPAEPLPQKARKIDLTVFALVSTQDLAGVVSGVLTDTGATPELEGHPKTSLALHVATPVFDGNLRFVGFARAVAWDQDKLLLVPPEMISEARTATAAAAERQEKARRRDTRPWWAK